MTDSIVVDGEIVLSKVLDGERLVLSNLRNVVTGTFNIPNTGVRIVDIPYNGKGYPIALMIYPSEGLENVNGSFYNTSETNVVSGFFAFKCNPALAPTYESNTSIDDGPYDNQYFVYVRYKTTGSWTVTYRVNKAVANIEHNPSATVRNAALFKSNNKLAVYIKVTSTGFKDGLQYVYKVFYSN